MSGRKLSLTHGDHVDLSSKTYTEHQQNVSSKCCHWKIRSVILALTGAQGVRMCVLESSKRFLDRKIHFLEFFTFPP